MVQPPLWRRLSPGIPRPLAGIINSVSPLLVVGPACGERQAKGFALASARIDQGRPPLEQPDCCCLTQHLAWLSSASSHNLHIKHQGDQLLSLVSGCVPWRLFSKHGGEWMSLSHSQPRL